MKQEELQLVKISEEEFDKLAKQGVATLFDHTEPFCGHYPIGCCDCYPGFQGFFDHRSESPDRSILLLSNKDGFFIRAYDDLRRSEDGVFVDLIDSSKSPKDETSLPNFSDVFELREI